MYRVLMPIDGSEERALAQARTAAALPEADGEVQVTLLHVFEDRERAEDTSAGQTVAGKEVLTLLDERGVTVEEESRYGDAATEILAAAEETDADLILLGGRKRSPLGSALFGSVSQSVLLDANRPVTITGSDVVTGEAVT